MAVLGTSPDMEQARKALYSDREHWDQLDIERGAAMVNRVNHAYARARKLKLILRKDNKPKSPTRGKYKLCDENTGKPITREEYIDFEEVDKQLEALEDDEKD